MRNLLLLSLLLALLVDLGRETAANDTSPTAHQAPVIFWRGYLRGYQDVLEGKP
jgi:hypothetical protein